MTSKLYRAVHVALLLLALPGSLAAVTQGIGCNRVALDPSPSWTNSAAWSEDGKELTLVDILGGRLLRYSNGKYSGSVARPGMGELEFNQPSALTAIPGGYLLASPPGKVIWLNRGFDPFRGLDLLKAGKGGHIQGKLEIFDWEYPQLFGNYFLGTAVLHIDGKPWKGLVRASLKPFELTDLIEEIDYNAPEDRLFRLLGTESAASGGGDYVLRWARPTAYILQIWPQKRRLKTFPPGFEALPALPQGVGGMEGGPILYKALERSTLAVGLYGQGAYLYLLARKPAGQGTLWQLWQIDPQRDTIIRSMTLPTQANHLFLAPGPINWAVIEKGPVIQMGSQSIKSMLLLPSSWIEDTASKVLADGNAVSCH